MNDKGIFLSRAPSAVCGWVDGNKFRCVAQTFERLKIKVLSLSQHDPSLVFQSEQRTKKKLRARPICCQPVRTHVNLWIYIFLVFYFSSFSLSRFYTISAGWLSTRLLSVFVDGLDFSRLLLPRFGLVLLFLSSSSTALAEGRRSHKTPIFLSFMIRT